MSDAKSQIEKFEFNSVPTMRTVDWSVTHFFDTAKELLESDHDATELRLYFYAVTLPGWSMLSALIDAWKTNQDGRSVIAYIGTDHALTDPEAIEAMKGDGVEVFLLRRYIGVFHPKVMWFVTERGGTLLAGSNNFTEDGLKNNIEFATLTKLRAIDEALSQWHAAVHDASDTCSRELLESYRREKERFGQLNAKSSQEATFTWSRRTAGIGGKEAGALGGIGAVSPGDLILEVMPRETSMEGRQVQIPMRAATEFFGLGAEAGASITLSLKNMTSGVSRELTFTRNANRTARLSIRELEYRSRPCVLLIRRSASGDYEFEIVRREIHPGRYSRLISLCPNRSTDRRWIMTEGQQRL